MSIADYTARPTRFTIAPRGEPMFSERATTIEIDDEADGEFIRVRQCPEGEPEAVININPEEWPLIRSAINRAVRLCQENEA